MCSIKTTNLQQPQQSLTTISSAQSNADDDDGGDAAAANVDNDMIIDDVVDTQQSDLPSASKKRAPRREQPNWANSYSDYVHGHGDIRFGGDARDLVNNLLDDFMLPQISQIIIQVLDKERKKTIKQRDVTTQMKLLFGPSGDDMVDFCSKAVKTYKKSFKKDNEDTASRITSSQLLAEKNTSTLNNASSNKGDKQHTTTTNDDNSSSSDDEEEEESSEVSSMDDSI